MAVRSAINQYVYGSYQLGSISLQSLYGAAFQYADKVFHGGAYTGSKEMTSDPKSIGMYFNAVSEGASPMAFVLYVPGRVCEPGFDQNTQCGRDGKTREDLHRPF